MLGPILAKSGIGAINVIATVASMWLIDRIGRRPLLILGIVPMALSMGVFSVSLRLGEGAAWTHGLAVVCFGIFVTAFAISLVRCLPSLYRKSFPKRFAAKAWVLPQRPPGVREPGLLRKCTKTGSTSVYYLSGNC
jgi:hypothetical protein